MIDLTLERPGEHHHVRSVDEDGIRIGAELYTGALILTPEQILDNWTPDTVGDLEIGHLDALFELQPEVALLGTGRKHAILPRELMIAVYRRGVSLEVMTTDAACRTFNILAADGRQVVAGLLPMVSGPQAQ
jgi:uncharacterized protein